MLLINSWWCCCLVQLRFINVRKVAKWDVCSNHLQPRMCGMYCVECLGSREWSWDWWIMWRERLRNSTLLLHEYSEHLSCPLRVATLQSTRCTIVLEGLPKATTVRILQQEGVQRHSPRWPSLRHRLKTSRHTLWKLVIRAEPDAPCIGFTGFLVVGGMSITAVTSVTTRLK